MAARAHQPSASFRGGQGVPLAQDTPASPLTLQGGTVVAFLPLNIFFPDFKMNTCFLERKIQKDNRRTKKKIEMTYRHQQFPIYKCAKGKKITIFRYASGYAVYVDTSIHRTNLAVFKNEHFYIDSFWWGKREKSGHKNNFVIYPKHFPRSLKMPWKYHF